MKSPVIPVRILLMTKFTHGEFYHSRVFSVIRYSINDCISWAANHTADKRMLISGICLVLQFFQTFRAYGKICGYCLLYTSDAADEEDSVDLGGRRIIK